MIYGNTSVWNTYLNIWGLWLCWFCLVPVSMRKPFKLISGKYEERLKKSISFVDEILIRKTWKKLLFHFLFFCSFFLNYCILDIIFSMITIMIIIMFTSVAQIKHFKHLKVYVLFAWFLDLPLILTIIIQFYI